MAAFRTTKLTSFAHNLQSNNPLKEAEALKNKTADPVKSVSFPLLFSAPSTEISLQKKH
jgi:hypothetical protein